MPLRSLRVTCQQHKVDILWQEEDKIESSTISHDFWVPPSSPLNNMPSTPAKSPKASTFKFPPMTEPEFRTFFSTENEKMKEEHPGWKQTTRKSRIRALWKKEHDSYEAPAKIKESKAKHQKSASGSSFDADR
ncbi:hypothetical protein JCM11641_005549 [Rhodosporidiobolus odoratus]